MLSLPALPCSPSQSHWPHFSEMFLAGSELRGKIKLTVYVLRFRSAKVKKKISTTSHLCQPDFFGCLFKKKKKKHSESQVILGGFFNNCLFSLQMFRDDSRHHRDTDKKEVECFSAEPSLPREQGGYNKKIAVSQKS